MTFEPDSVFAPSGVAYTETLPRKRMAAAVLFHDELGLLLVAPSYQPDWELPGGCVEGQESPYAAAIREIQEELRLTVTPGPLLVIDWVPPREGRTDMLMLVFDGGTPTAEQIEAIQLRETELSGLGMVYAGGRG